MRSTSSALSELSPSSDLGAAYWLLSEHICSFNPTTPPDYIAVNLSLVVRYQVRALFGRISV